MAEPAIADQPDTSTASSSFPQGLFGPPAVPPGAISPQPTRAEASDYLERTNYNPDAARALAAHERLANLGAHPAVVAQAVAPQIPPTPAVVPVVAKHPTVAAVPKPTPKTDAPIDLSGGFVPLSSAPSKHGKAPANKGDQVDLSGGFVPLAQPAAPAPEPDKGAVEQIKGAVRGPIKEVGGVFTGLHDLFQEPQNDEEKDIQQKVMVGDKGELGGRIALAAYRMGHGFLSQLEAAKASRDNETSTSGKILATAENYPFIGDLVKKMESGDYDEAITQGLTRALLMKAGGKSAESTEAAPIAGAPLTMGEKAGPGLAQGAEKLFSKTSTAQNRMGDVMEGRTAAMTRAAKAASPAATSLEDTGATVQNAARDVIDRQGQAQSLVGDLANRAKTEAETAKSAATENAGTAAQDAATRQLNARRTADVEGANRLAKNASGVDELPVPETDREIVSSLRGANSAAKVEESAAHNALAEAAKAKGITVDPAPMQSVAKDIVELEGPAKDLVMSSLPATTYKMLEKVANTTQDASHPLDEISQSVIGRPYREVKALAESQKGVPGDAAQDWGAKLQQVEKVGQKEGISPEAAKTGGVPYDVMKTARTAVGEALQSARKHFQQSGLGSNAVRTLQQLYGSMTDALKTSVSGDPDLAAQFEKANALTRERASTFVDPKFVRKLVYADDPGKIMGSVMRSGSDSDVGSLRTALDADKTGQGLARAQRGAMDYILRKSAKSATFDLPSGVRPDAVDYDVAVRNAKASTALRTILGDDKYNKFVSGLDAKRIAQRSPDEINLDNQLTKIAKADTPEKAAKLAGFDAGAEPAVKAAEQKAGNAAAARDRLQSPSAIEAGPQKVAQRVADELEPSKIVEHAAGSPEYTDKLLSVLDKHPNATTLRQTLGQRIFRNASDGAMVRGAFGSSDGIFDVEKFQSEFNKARPSLQKILPPENLAAMDRYNQALDKYALSKGIGGGAGMSGRFLAMRQIFGVVAMARGVLSGSPSTFAIGATASLGPRLWMEIATRPQLANSVTKLLNAGGKAIRGAEIGARSQDRDLDARLDAVPAAQTSSTIPTKQANNTQSTIPTGVPSTQKSTPAASFGQGFQRPEMEEHKRAGMKAAAEAKNTPEHLRPHLEKMAGDGAAKAPSVGDKVSVKGKSYTVGKVYPDGSWDPK